MKVMIIMIIHVTLYYNMPMNQFFYYQREFLPEMQKSLERIIDIWSQRGVYEAGVIEKFQASLG